MLRTVSRGHDGTSLLLDALALSKKLESRCWTTGGKRAVLADETQADGTGAAGVTGFWRGRCAREPECGQPRPGMASRFF